MNHEKLSEARRIAIHEALRDARLYSRRAQTPEQRMAYAEIEHELLEIEKRWESVGLINGQCELPLAAEAPSKR